MSDLNNVYTKDGLPRAVQRKLKAVKKTENFQSYEAYNLQEGLLDPQIHDKWVGTNSSWVETAGTTTTPGRLPKNVYDYANAPESTTAPSLTVNDTQAIVSTGTAKNNIFDKIQVYESAKHVTAFTANSLDAGKEKANADVRAAQDLRTWFIAENAVYIVSLMGVATVVVGMMMSRTTPSTSSPP